MTESPGRTEERDRDVLQKGTSFASFSSSRSAKLKRFVSILALSSMDMEADQVNSTCSFSTEESDVYGGLLWSAPDQVSGKTLLRVAMEDEWQVLSCASLPFTVCFFCLFMVFFQVHYDTTAIFLLERPLRQSFATLATELSRPQELHGWLEHAYVPFMWSCNPEAELGTTTQGLHHELVGGVELATERAREGPCLDESVDHMWCHTLEDSGTGQAFAQALNESVAGRRLRLSEPVARLSGAAGPQAGSGRYSSMVLPNNWQLNEVQDVLASLEENHVVRETTLLFSTRAVLFHGKLNRNFVTLVEIIFSFSRAGDLINHVQIITITYDHKDALPVLILSAILWLACLVTSTLKLPMRAHASWKRGRLRNHAFRFWNIVEWCIMVGGWMIVTLYALERIAIMSVRGAIDDFYAGEDAAEERAQYQIDELPGLIDKVGEVARQAMWVQVFVAVYNVLLVARFMLAVRGQPRLAIVLNTLGRASMDIFHVLIVVGVVFMAYAVSGHILFGWRMAEFSTMGASIAKCFEIAMEREFPWRKFTEQDWYTSTLWVWSFLMLVVLVLVNIFLAMIFDAYGEVRSHDHASATLWETTKHALQFTRHFVGMDVDAGTRWIPNSELIQVIRDIGCDTITPWMLKDALPMMANRQVNYVFNLASNKREIGVLNANKGILPELLAGILLCIKDMHGSLIASHPSARIPGRMKKFESCFQHAYHAVNKAHRAQSYSSLGSSSDRALVYPVEDMLLPVQQGKKAKWGFDDDGDLTPPAVKQEMLQQKEEPETEIPSEPPAWIRNQLRQHLRQQLETMRRLNRHVDSIEAKLLNPDVPSMPVDELSMAGAFAWSPPPEIPAMHDAKPRSAAPGVGPRRLKPSACHLRGASGGAAMPGKRSGKAQAPAGEDTFDMDSVAEEVPMLDDSLAMHRPGQRTAPMGATGCRPPPALAAAPSPTASPTRGRGRRAKGPRKSITWASTG